MKHLKKIWCFLIICFLVCSCKTRTLIQEVPVEVPIIKTEYIQKADSVYQKDSIYQIIETRHDTIFNTKTVIQYKYKEKIDTICRTDTINKPVYITKTVTKEVVPWKKMFWIGFGCLTIFLGLLIYKKR